MTLETFTEKLHVAVHEVLSNASAVLVEPVDKPVVFMVYTRDDVRERDETPASLAQKLYHDGTHPTWVNLYVTDVTDTATVIRCAYSDERVAELPEGGAAPDMWPFNALTPTPPQALKDAFIEEAGEEGMKNGARFHEYLSTHKYHIATSPSHTAYTPMA